jgi:hypothetical protein
MLRWPGVRAIEGGSVNLYWRDSRAEKRTLAREKRKEMPRYYTKNGSSTHTQHIKP